MLWFSQLVAGSVLLTTDFEIMLLHLCLLKACAQHAFARLRSNREFFSLEVTLCSSKSWENGPEVMLNG